MTGRCTCDSLRRGVSTFASANGIVDISALTLIHPLTQMVLTVCESGSLQTAFSKQMKIRDLLEQADSSHTAIRTETHTFTYAELGRLVDSLTRALGDFGLCKGDRIAIALPNGLEV